MPFFRLYLLLAALDVAAIALNAPAPVRWLTKPSLMAALIVYVWRQSRRAPLANAGAANLGRADSWRYRLLLAALACAWLGDVALLASGATAFLLGLGAFLLGHLLYLVIFARLSTVPLRPGAGLWLGFSYAGVLAAFVLLYLPWLQAGMGALGGAVQVYMAVICAMTVAAALLFQRVPLAVWARLFAGSLLFVISDAVLAWQVFRQPFEGGSVLVMATYAAAQGLIVAGVLGSEK